MSLVSIREATIKELRDICEGMSPKDVETMRRWFANSSQAWAGFYEDRIACLYGIISPSILSDTAYLWLTTNELVHEHPFLFVRHSQMVIEHLLRTHDRIVGHVSVNNLDAIKWLEWLGMKLARGDMKNDLIPFNLKRSG